MREHRLAGYEDTMRTLRHREWLKAPGSIAGIAVHDLHHDDPT